MPRIGINEVEEQVREALRTGMSLEDSNKSATAGGSSRPLAFARGTSVSGALAGSLRA